MATGFAANGHSDVSVQTPFAQTWNGSGWSFLTTPSGGDAPRQLYGVSCSSPTSCLSVGPGPTALRWTASGWTAQAPPGPLDTDPSGSVQFSSVSCPNGLECRAVGAYRNTAGYVNSFADKFSGAGVGPTVTTKAATTSGEINATLRGLVNPNGLDTTYYYEYGTTEAYGSKTAEGSVGAGFNPNEVTQPITVQPGVKYHYRLVAGNGSVTSKGADMTVETQALLKAPLAEMPVTDYFNGGSSPISDFNTKWAALGWAGGTVKKGKNNTNGWGPVEAAPTVNGAYFLPSLADTGQGLAAEATMAVSPGASGRFSLWLDLANPASAAKSGYELRFQATATDVYTVTLARWVAGTETVLGTKAGYSFVAGSSLALVDSANAVSGWTDTGAGFAPLFNVADSAYAGGYAGVEATGAATRLTKFKLGPPLKKVGSVDAALKAAPMMDPFSSLEFPLSFGGAWAALMWDNSPTGYNTGRTFDGWAPVDSYPTVNGAFWKKAATADVGSGDAVEVTMTALPQANHYVSLWLNASNPAASKSGYELRLTGTATTGVFELKITRWVSGVATVVASKAGVSLSAGSRFALFDRAGVIGAWAATPGTGFNFSLVTSVFEPTFSYGYGGIEASGNIVRLREFRLGALPPI